MRIKCRYSSVEFVAAGFNQLKVTGEHPLMSVDMITLLSRARDWAEGKLDRIEQRVLFVALLKSTDLVEFRTAAIPEDKVIAKFMEPLIRTMGWKEKLGDLIPLPKYVITPDTYRLTNINHWLRSWETAKQDWESKGAFWNQREKLRLREEALIRLIRSPTRKLSFYQGMLGRWILEASDAPEGIKDYWLQLLRLKDNKDIWAANKVDLEELLEHMEDNLPAGSIIADVAFKHVRRLLQINTGGLEFGIGMDDDNADLRYADLRNNPYVIIPETTEEHNIQAVISAAPATEPKLEEFERKVDFIRATARWRIAQQFLSDRERQEQKQKELDFNLEVSKDHFSEIDTEVEQMTNALKKLSGDL